MALQIKRLLYRTTFIFEIINVCCNAWFSSQRQNLTKFFLREFCHALYLHLAKELTFLRWQWFRGVKERLNEILGVLLSTSYACPSSSRSVKCTLCSALSTTSWSFVKITHICRFPTSTIVWYALLPSRLNTSARMALLLSTFSLRRASVTCSANQVKIFVAWQSTVRWTVISLWWVHHVPHTTAIAKHTATTFGTITPPTSFFLSHLLSSGAVHIMFLVLLHGFFWDLIG